MEKQAKLKPGRWLYLLGSLIIAAGIVVTVAISAVLAAKVLSGKISAEVPGQTQLNLDKTGTYVMTFDYYTSDGGKTKITNLSEYSGLSFRLTDSSDTDVPIKTIAGSAREFVIAKPGTYTLSATYGSAVGPSAVMMILSAGQSALSVAANAILLLCLAAGIIIIIVTAVKRKKAKKQLLNP